MLSAVLEKRNVSVWKRFAIQSIISVSMVVLGAVLLPQFVHIVAGAKGGMTWLPMYLPVLLAGCLLGYEWALVVGICSPFVSFLFTAFAGLTIMPSVERLPFMIAELSVFAIVSGLFSKLILKNGNWAFLAVFSAQLCGRLTFLLLTFIFQSVLSFNVISVLNQFKMGIGGLLLQLIIVPVVVFVVRHFAQKEAQKEA